jgi:hypothetical protein
MWPFRKKATTADRTIEVWDDAVGHAAEQWIYFSKVFVFKDDAGLRERIFSFSIPMFEGLRSTFPPLKEAPDSVLLLLVAKCIEKSGTHSRPQIETALEMPLPD